MGSTVNWETTRLHPPKHSKGSLGAKNCVLGMVYCCVRHLEHSISWLGIGTKSINVHHVGMHSALGSHESTKVIMLALNLHGEVDHLVHGWLTLVTELLHT